MKTLIKIFLTFTKIGAFSFGGGLAMLPMIEEEIVRNHQWLSAKEFVDVVAIAEMTPGPIAVNASTFVGYKVAGMAGALAGSIGVAIVSFILITLLAKFFMGIKDAKGTKAVFEGIRPAVLGLILSAGISIGKTAFVDWKSVGIAFVIFIGVGRLKMHPILAIVTAGIIGAWIY
ncbi:chromate transporter [Thermotalea metallivorans]|uniref:Putative chromate transport protein n=1 Tax=Thermotalea metallivorans TaxID=520762 RepID=A0A140L7G2_9FIRM|nr:chromate transporter [Thermotalea metallivorans]KXG76487.1 putative chromate transport protein [Thermotalea metallivorans]